MKTQVIFNKLILAPLNYSLLLQAAPDNVNLSRFHPRPHDSLVLLAPVNSSQLHLVPLKIMIGCNNQVLSQRMLYKGTKKMKIKIKTKSLLQHTAQCKSSEYSNKNNKTLIKTNFGRISEESKNHLICVLNLFLNLLSSPNYMYEVH